MIKLSVNKGTVEKNMQGRLNDCLAELVVGNASVLKDISKDKAEYAKYLSGIIAAMLCIDYDEIEGDAIHE